MNCEMEIKKVLKEIGVTPDLDGYHYLEKAILIIKNCFKNDGIAMSFWELYNDISNQFGKKRTSVERCMRHAKVVAENARTDLFNSIFGGLKDITLSSFIGVLAEYILIKEKENEL